MSGKSEYFIRKYPDIAKYYDNDKNKTDVTLVKVNGKEQVYWKCDNGHSFCESVYKFVREKKRFFCDICDNTMRENGVTEFVRYYPYIAKYYCLQKNDEDVNKVNTQNKNIVFWECDKGHITQHSVYYYVECLKEFACPECVKSQETKKIENFIGDRFPSCVEEWSPNNIYPIYCYSSSDKRLFLWRCKNCEGEYSATFSNKFQEGCPYCNDRVFLKGVNSVSERYPELALDWSEKNELKVDEVFCNKDNLEVEWKCHLCGYEYWSYLGDRTGRTKYNRECSCCRGNVLVKGVNSFSNVAPRLIKYWGSKNIYSPEDTAVNILNPEHCYNKFYFICDKCGGEYYIHYLEKGTKEDDCPYCSGKKVLAGFNSLDVTNEELAKEWSDNNTKPITEFMETSSYRALWVCLTCKWEYSYPINEREVGDNSCPYCSGKIVIAKFDTLADAKPELIGEWSDNNKLPPSRHLAISQQYALWNCPICKGEYSYIIRYRYVGDDSCPYCRGKKVLAGVNSLDVTNEELAKEWSKNNTISITEVMATSCCSVLWVCPTCKGEYSRIIRDRYVGDDSCPYCSGKKLLAGVNSFKKRHPDLMPLWDNINNYLLCNPDEILDNYNENVFWICENNPNHKYRCSPKRRIIYQKRGIEPCTYCRGLRRKKRHFI